MASRTIQFACFSLVGLSLFAACGSSDGREAGDADSSVAGSGNGSGGSSSLDPGTGGNPLIDAPPSEHCGDGVRDDDEACDDGNQEPDDGCHSNCLVLNPGFTCATPGEPCSPFARCGDSLVVFPEQCDDGNLDASDGCSATCKVEIGFKCDGSPSTCSATTCGDGVLEGAETCDDGNDLPLDGCNALCQAEPKCTSDGCTSSCGDGLVLGEEECDDGNALNGDGCSDVCVKEAGYECTQGAACDALDPDCVLTIPAIFRDFKESHTDFGVGCGSYVPGIAADMLNDDGKPVLKSSTNACIQSASSFQEWYGGAAGDYTTLVSSINLFPNETGAFVNRLTEDGERYTRPLQSGITWCSNDSNQCDSCAPGYKTCYAECTPWGNKQTCAEYEGDTISFDGNPLFFPIAVPNGEAGQVAAIPEEVYGGGWKEDPSKTPRNFLFTSEVTYWFKYETGSTATLAFNGDDDVWVYLNRRLAVDLGGLHVPLEGVMTISDTGIALDMPDPSDNKKVIHTTKTLASFGLEDGGVYEIKVFHAERKPTGSSFKLTLSGFNTSRSDCSSVCGDGIIGAGEECDDGENTGGYNKCQPGCVLGGFCGDGVVQEDEVCDDLDPNKPSNCSGCHIIEIK